MRYIFDLDNTLCDTRKNEEGNWDYVNSLPFQDRIDIVNKLYDEGNYIVIETARGSVSKKNWYEETYKQLVSFGLKFNELRTGVKFNGDIFIDDKGVNSEVFFSEKKIELVEVFPEKTKITLFNEIFVEKNELRLDEYVFCINRNIENESIEKIYLVCNKELYNSNQDYFYQLFNHRIKQNNKVSLILDDNRRFTFNNLLDFVKLLVPNNKIVCVSNLDIFIPNTSEWSNLEKDIFSITGNDFAMALSRTEYVNDVYSFRDEPAWELGEFADTWLFKTPIKLTKNDFPCEIPVGSAPGCDSHMFMILKKNYKLAFNWADKYVTYHYDLIRKPEVLEKKSGRMIIHNDTISLPERFFDDIPREEWTIIPYQDWQSKIKEYVIEKKLQKKKMEKGALEDKFALSELVKLVEKFDVKRIIETGTYLGWSTKKLSKLNLKVDTIEINEEYYEKAKETVISKNVTFYSGNSVDVLSEIVEEGEGNILFFLDSHWMDLPLLDELELIYKKKIKPIILIHDFFVPDKNGKAKFGYDQYDDKCLNMELIKDYIDKIYDGEYSYHYTSEIDCVDSGTIYIYPKEEENE